MSFYLGVLNMNGNGAMGCAVCEPLSMHLPWFGTGESLHGIRTALCICVQPRYVHLCIHMH